MPLPGFEIVPEEFARFEPWPDKVAANAAAAKPSIIYPVHVTIRLIPSEQARRTFRYNSTV
jgi:hypothetical protein